MKRQILCRRCASGHPVKKYDGEWSTRVYGKATRQFFCDFCNKDIETGEICCADSMGLDGDVKYEWEDEYIIKEAN